MFIVTTLAAVGCLSGQPIWRWFQRPLVLRGIEGSGLQMEEFEVTLWPDGRHERRVVRKWELGAQE